MEYFLIRKSLFVRINRSDELSVVNCTVIGYLPHNNSGEKYWSATNMPALMKSAMLNICNNCEMWSQVNDVISDYYYFGIMFVVLA